MQREVRAVLSAAGGGRRGVREFPVNRVNAYSVESSMDNDVDNFSIDIGDPNLDLDLLLARDTEVRLSLFLNNEQRRMVHIFSGIADQVVFDTDDQMLSIAGRDYSSLALGDSPPGKWRHVKPQQFIQRRAHELGFPAMRIHKMAEIGTLYTDASETDWQLWYRMVRAKGFYMWTTAAGKLVVDHLNYNINPAYKIGTPPRGQTLSGWVMPKKVMITKDTSGRQGQVWVYAEDAKTGRPYVSRGIDTTIRNWRRRPLKIITSSAAKSTKEAKQEADLEVFESIVGALEIEVTIYDSGRQILQNQMCRLRVPEAEIDGTFYIVGVRETGGMDGMEQVLRLREKGFALSKRKPDAPTLTQTDTSGQKVPASIGAALANQGVRWADSFVRATREFGVPAGWDFAVFCGVLLSICDKETGFRNVRGSVSGARNGYEWQPFDVFEQDPRNYESGFGNASRHLYESTFANERSNPLNPRYPQSNTAVGPMQLVSGSYREWADQYGWNGRARPGEYDGGRWNPDSNIRAAARALVDKLNAQPKADPNNANQIWLGVARYYGSSSSAANDAYTADVRRRYDAQFAAASQSAVQAAQSLPLGTSTSLQIPNHGQLQVPANTPDSVRKAINFCLRRLGDRYQYGGTGPNYDCSSLVTAAYATADPGLRDKLDEPDGRHHGESTYTLFEVGRFKSIVKDNLLAGDLVFFHHGGRSPEHVGMYLADGLMVHDPHTGDVIKISGIGEDWYADHYLGARRLIDWGYTAFVTDFPG